MKRKLYRSNDSVIFGVCAGLAEHADLNPWGMRLIWVLLTCFFPPFPLIIYVVLAVVLERRPQLPPVPGSRMAPPPVPEAPTRSETLARLQQRLQSLDKRLQRMESVVTRPSFGLEEEYRK